MKPQDPETVEDVAHLCYILATLTINLMDNFSPPMPKDTTVRARLEPELKEEGEGILKYLGLSTSDYINIAWRQLIIHQGLPFEMRIPNEETAAAIKEAAADFKADRLKRYDSTDELFSDWDKEAAAESDK